MLFLDVIQMLRYIFFFLEGFEVLLYSHTALQDQYNHSVRQNKFIWKYIGRSGQLCGKFKASSVAKYLSHNHKDLSSGPPELT